MEPCLFYRGWSLFWSQTRLDLSLGLYGITLSTGYSAHLLSLEWNMVQAMNISCRRNLEKFSVEIAHPNKGEAECQGMSEEQTTDIKNGVSI